MTDMGTEVAGLRIVRLAVDNVMRIEAVEIVPDPDGNLVVIAGANGSGKTSLLNAIFLTLGGGDASRTIARAIRDGQDEASVRLNLGDLRVVRTWKRDKNGDEKTTLKVESADGTRKYNSPQQMLDSLIGRLSFDPLTFANLPPREQVTTLLSLIDLPFNLDDMAARRRALFDERTIAGRELKQAEGQLAGLPPAPPADTPDEEVSGAALLAEIREAQQAHHAAEDAMLRHRQARDRVQRAREELAAAEAALAQTPLPDTSALPDVAEMEARLADLDSVNAAVRIKRDRRAVEERLATVRRRHQEHTDAIEALDAEKAEALRNAAMPIPGLSFDDDGVTYRGVPFAQSSSAEQLRVSVAMAMALNPKVRVIRITDGSLLDADNLRLIEEMAGANDYQVWLERVGDPGEVGIVIAEGRVVEVRTGKRAKS